MTCNRGVSNVWKSIWWLPLHGVWALTFIIAAITFLSIREAVEFLGGYCEEDWN